MNTETISNSTGVVPVLNIFAQRDSKSTGSDNRIAVI